MTSTPPNPIFTDALPDPGRAFNQEAGRFCLGCLILLAAIAILVIAMATLAPGLARLLFF